MKKKSLVGYVGWDWEMVWDRNNGGWVFHDLIQKKPDRYAKQKVRITIEEIGG